MRTACGDQAVAIVPMKALRLGLSPWSFRVLCELFAVPKTDGFWCILCSSIHTNLFPLPPMPEKALHGTDSVRMISHDSQEVG